MQLTNVGQDALESPGSNRSVSRASNRARETPDPASEAVKARSGAAETAGEQETDLSESGDRVSAAMDRVQSRSVSAPQASHVRNSSEAAEIARWATQQMSEEPGTAILAQANLSPRAAWSLLRAL